MAAGRGPAAPGAGPGLGDARPGVPGPTCRRPGGPALRAAPPRRRPRRPVSSRRRRRRGRQREVRPDPHDRGAGPPRHDPSRAARPGAAGRDGGADPPGAGPTAAGPDSQGHPPPAPPDAGRGQDAATDVLAARRRGGPGRPGRRRRRPRRGRRLLAGCDRGVGHADHGPAHLRPARRVSGGARGGPRGGLPLRRRRARRDRGRHLHRLPGLLHRRHRLLPVGARRPGAHRSRWPLLQRDDRRGVRAPLRRHGQRPVAADRVGAAAADAAAAHPDRAVRRLLRPVRPGRRARPVRQGRTGAALAPAGAPSRSSRHRAEAPGAPVRDRLGAGRRAAADGCAGVGHLARAGLRRRRPSSHPAAAAGLRRRLGAPRLGCHGPGRRVDRTDPGPARRADGRAVANRRDARHARARAGARPWPAGRSTA